MYKGLFRNFIKLTVLTIIFQVLGLSNLSAENRSFEVHNVEVPLKDHHTVNTVKIPLFDRNKGELVAVMIQVMVKLEAQLNFEQLGADMPPDFTDYHSYLSKAFAQLKFYTTEAAAMQSEKPFLIGAVNVTAKTRGNRVYSGYDGATDAQGNSGDRFLAEHHAGTVLDPQIFVRDEDLRGFLGNVTRTNRTLWYYNPGWGPIECNKFSALCGLMALIGGEIKIVYIYNSTSAQQVSPPATPNEITASTTLNFIRLNWNASQDASHYIVYRRAASQSSEQNCQRNRVWRIVKDLEFNDVDLQSSVGYIYNIIAVNQYGYSDCSSPVQGMAIGTVLKPPTNLPTDIQYSQIASGTVMLTWNPVSSATEYEVRRSRVGMSSGPYEPLSIVPGELLIDTPLEIGTYYYRIRAKNYAGNGEFTDVIPVQVQ